MNQSFENTKDYMKQVSWWHMILIKNVWVLFTFNKNWELGMINDIYIYIISYVSILRTWRSLGGYSTWLVAFTIAISNSFINKMKHNQSKQ